jgi:hypothetical protein
MKSILLHILLFGLAFSIKAQDKIESSFESSEGKVVVRYEIKADNDRDYTVSLILKRTGNSSYSYVPANLQGDIGEGRFAGGIRTIVWLLSTAEQKNLEGDDYYFEITAVPVGRGIPWYVYVGTVAVGGGVAAVLTMAKKSDSSTSTGSLGIPEPPSRPTQ